MSIVIKNRFSGLIGEKRVRVTTIAKETGISRTTLTNLYYGRSGYISFDVLDKLCRYLKCGVDDIFAYEAEDA